MFSFAPGNTVVVLGKVITAPPEKKPVKQNPKIINIPKLCKEINKVVPGTAQFTGNGLKLNGLAVKIGVGFSEYGQTKLRFTNFRDLIDNLLLDQVVSLSKQQKQYLITGYNRTMKKNKGNEHRF